MRSAALLTVMLALPFLAATAGSAHAHTDLHSALPAEVIRLAPVERRLVASSTLSAGGRRVAARRALVVGFDLRAIRGLRRATLSLGVRGRSRPPLRLYAISAGSLRRARVIGGALRGRYVSSGRVIFNVSARVRGRSRARFFVTAAGRRSWRPVGRPALVARVAAPVPAPAPAASTPQPAPTPNPAPAVSPEPTPGPTPDTTPEPTPETAVVVAAGDISCSPESSKYNGGEGTGTSCRQMATSDAMLAQSPDAVLPLGDNQYEDGTLSEFQTAYAPSWGRALGISHPVAGNHEYRIPGAAGYFDYFNGVDALDGRAGERGKGYYSYDVGTWHLIALNSNCSQVPCAAGSAQEQWLRQDLALHDSACTLAYFHAPRWTSGTVGDSTAVTPLWEALYDHGADLVINGHAHIYERFARQDPSGTVDSSFGIRQLIAGSGGKDLQTLGEIEANSEVVDNTTLGILRLSLDVGSYDWEFVPVVGTFSDAGSDVCHGAPGD